MPVILATQEAEIRRITAQSQPGKIVQETLSQKKKKTTKERKETDLTDKDKYWLRVKGQKKIFQTNGPQKQTEVAILISDKTYFRPKLLRRDNESHFILIKGKIHIRGNNNS
jgi:hypothetical protein